jgi:hypothetical protein
MRVMVFTLALLVAIPASARPKRRVADKRFWIVTALHGAATVADLISTDDFLHQCPTCTETGFYGLVGGRPSDAEVWSVGLALFAGETTITYFLKRNRTLDRTWLWAAWPAYEIVNHARWAYLNEQEHSGPSSQTAAVPGLAGPAAPVEAGGPSPVYLRVRLPDDVAARRSLLPAYIWSRRFEAPKIHLSPHKSGDKAVACVR